MSKREQGIAQQIDWLTLGIYFLLVCTGWAMIYAVEYDPENPSLFNFSKSYGKQALWIVLALAAGLTTLIIDGKFYSRFAYHLYGLSIILLILVLFLGADISGSRSWFNIGGFFKFQPAEIAKMATCLALASYLSPKKIKLSDFEPRIIALAIIGVPFILIQLQGDMGSALVYASLMIVLFRDGMPLPLYIIGISLATLSILALVFDPFPILFVMSLLAGALFIYNLKINQLWFGFAAYFIIGSYGMMNDYIFEVLITGAILLIVFGAVLYSSKKQVLSLLTLGSLLVAGSFTFSVNYVFFNLFKKHQQERVLMWLRPDLADPMGPLYNVTQSKMAIGSGGFAGRGFLKGTLTKLDYVPEQSTDFIFCTVGEELGFAGSAFLILLFMGIMLRIIQIAERQRSKFSKLYAYGVVSIFFFHFLINIGMTIGLTPTIGIPLPFISYGGSSLISFTMLLFILLKLDSQRLLEFR